jgi:hypothetical protein
MTWYSAEYDNYKDALAAYNSISPIAKDARLIVISEGMLYAVTYSV